MFFYCCPLYDGFAHIMSTSGQRWYKKGFFPPSVLLIMPATLCVLDDTISVDDDPENDNSACFIPPKPPLLQVSSEAVLVIVFIK